MSGDIASFDGWTGTSRALPQTRFCNIGNLLIFIFFLLDMDCLRSVKCVIFQTLYEKHLKTSIHTQSQNSHFDVFDPETSDSPDLTRGYRRLRRVLVSQTRSISFYRLCFRLIRLFCPAKPATPEKKTLIFDLTRDVTSDLQMKFPLYSERSYPGLSDVLGKRIGPVA